MHHSIFLNTLNLIPIAPNRVIIPFYTLSVFSIFGMTYGIKTLPLQHGKRYHYPVFAV